MATKDKPQTAVPNEMRRALQWVFGNDTGLSSMTIAGAAAEETSARWSSS